MNIGKIFKAERERLGLSQRAFAPLIGVTQTGLSKIESGRNWPTRTTIDSFCRYAKIPRAELYIEALEPIDFTW